MPYNKQDRNTAPFVDTPDHVQFGLLYDIADLERSIVDSSRIEQELLERIQNVRRVRARTVDRMYALESAAAAYDRALYEMRADPRWDQERYRRRPGEVW